MKVFFLLVSIVILQSTQYILKDLEVDLKKSIVRWSGAAAFSDYNQKGTIMLDQIDFKVEKDKIVELNAIANMQSLYNEYSDLTNHLKSEDFFDVQKYPMASFQSLENIYLNNNQKGILEGKLRIKDSEKVVSFNYEVRYIGKEILLKIKGNFNRTDFKINHNSPSLFKDLKDNAISDTVYFQTEIYFKKF